MMHTASTRRDNFFRATMRDPDANTAPDSVISEALAVVKTNIEAQARSEGRTLTGIQIDRALSIAQRMLRTMPRDDIRSFASSGQLRAIAEQSLAVAPAGDARAARLAASGHGAGGSAAAIATGLRGFMRGADAGERAGSSGARYSEIGGGYGNAEITRVMQQAHYEAVRLGIPWAANQPELLRLGPSAVKAIADVQLKQQSYQRLTKEAHFAAKDVVTLATYAKAKGIADANPLANATADVIRLGGDTQQQILIKDSITGYMRAVQAVAATPSDPAAQQRLDQAVQQQREVLGREAAKSAEARQTVERYQREARLPPEHYVIQQNNAAATVERANATADRTRQASDNAKAEDAFAAAAAPTPGKAPSPAPSAGKPTDTVPIADMITATSAPASPPTATKPPAPK